MSWGETLYLRNIIKSQRKYAPSDSVLAVLGSGMGKRVSGTDWQELDTISFTPKVDGSVKIKFTCISSTAAYGWARIEIYGGGKTHLIDTDYQNMESATFYPQINIPVKKGITYKIRVSDWGSYSTYTIDTIELCAQVVDTSMIEYTTY